jgi:GTP pyrophosphokinase
MEMHAETQKFAEQYAKLFGNSEKIKKGYELLAKACKIGKKDLNTYASHNTAVAKILMDIGMEKDLIIAGFIHNLTTLGLPEKEVENEFGQQILNIINEKEKLEKALSTKNDNIETTRKKLLIVMATNPNIFILQLAEALDKARKLKELPDNERQEFLKQAKEIYAQMAHKFGIYSISSEINEITFRETEPQKYAELEKKIAAIKEKATEKINSTKEKLKNELAKAGINATIYGRIKTAYSTNEKMIRKNCPIEKIYDIIALRIITETEKECYEALGITHSLWKPLPEEFDDYIAKPKENGYKSLHTTILIDNNTPIEIQIRTKEMQNFAEFGLASHWKYKGAKDSKYDKKIEWIKQIIEWQKETGTTKIGSLTKEIFTLTPKGEIIELPEGATALDFAYAVHTELGNKCQNAIINGKISPINTILHTGDVIEIITSQKQTPKVGWLSLVKTAKAKQKIRAMLHIKTKEEKPTKKTIQENAIKVTDKRVRLAKCCNPIPGDNIIGIKTTKRKISVHRTDCKEIEKIKSKKIDIIWAEGEKKEYETEIKITTNERIGILKEMLDVFAKNKIQIIKTSAKTIAQNMTNCEFVIKIKNTQQIEELEKKLYEIKGVTEIRR